MKRLGRLGSVAFFTVSASFVFQVLSMAFNNWKLIECTTCTDKDPLKQWATSMGLRCYTTLVASILKNNATQAEIPNDSYQTTVCMPNHFIKVKDPDQAAYCLNVSTLYADTACAIGNYNHNYCKCE